MWAKRLMWEPPTKTSLESRKCIEDDPTKSVEDNPTKKRKIEDNTPACLSLDKEEDKSLEKDKDKETDNAIVPNKAIVPDIKTFSV